MIIERGEDILFIMVKQPVDIKPVASPKPLAVQVLPPDPHEQEGVWLEFFHSGKRNLGDGGWIATRRPS